MNEIQEFLAGWLMEFGGGEISCETREDSRWYAHCARTAFNHDNKYYFNIYHAGDTVQINQKGLDYIDSSTGD